jgi:hypothetical protein
MSFDEHPDMATSPQQPHLTAVAPGRSCGARPLYERALAIREKVRGTEHPNTDRIRSNFATLLLDEAAR